jgi:hypothetical protein
MNNFQRLYLLVDDKSPCVRRIFMLMGGQWTSNKATNRSVLLCFLERQKQTAMGRDAELTVNCTTNFDATPSNLYMLCTGTQLLLITSATRNISTCRVLRYLKRQSNPLSSEIPLLNNIGFDSVQALSSVMKYDKLASNP